MSEPADFVDSWQFRTLMAGAFIAAAGIVLCLLGNHVEHEGLCTLGLVNLYAGNGVGFFGIAAGVLTLGWHSIRRRLDRDR